jgi:hypothetical protein
VESSSSPGSCSDSQPSSLRGSISSERDNLPRFTVYYAGSADRPGTRKRVITPRSPLYAPRTFLPGPLHP